MKTIKCLLMAFFLAGLAFTQNSTELDLTTPPEVLKTVEDALRGNTRTFFDHFESNKTSMNFPSTTKLSDVKVGDPIVCFTIQEDSLKKVDENTPVSKLIKNYGIDWSKKSNHYEFPLLFNGKVITNIKVWKDNTDSSYAIQWHLAGWNNGVEFEQEWQKVIQKWPKSKGYNPILVSTYNNRFVYEFIYIPEKGDYNLTLMKFKDHPADSLTLTIDSTYSKLSDSRKILRYLKTSIESDHSKGGNLK